MATLTRNGRAVRCFFVGYNGVGNTGADVRLLTAIADVREAFGENTHISVMTIDAERTAAILPTDIEIEVIEVSFAPIRLTIALWNLARKHDVLLLVEGSTFKQNWSVWLLHAYLWAAQCARWTGNYAVAYAVDVGELTGIHAWRTRHECERLAIVMTRTRVARDRLIKLGVRRPVLANTDTAFRFVCDPERHTGRRVVGLAPIEFFHWPVRFRPRCRPEEKYRGPFAFTWNAERRTQSEAMLQVWVNLARHAIERHDLDIRMIAMEDLDTPVCERIIAELCPSASDRVSLASSHQLTPLKMTAILRGLDGLVTSRYHACVLSMGGAVPQMAICHDERLASIYTEIGIEQEYLLQYTEPNLSDQLISTFDRMMKNCADMSNRIRETHARRFLPLCAQNRIDLEAWGLRTFQTVSTDSDNRQNAPEKTVDNAEMLPGSMTQ